VALRIIFMGTPHFSIPTLNKIIEQGHEVCAVYTQPPRKAGRGSKLRQTPIHDFAQKAGLRVFTPKSLKSTAEIDAFKALKADVAVVIAYGLILPKAILQACPNGCLNVHGSLLPRWRGAAPIQRAIMAGDDQTGVMIMQMDQGLDTGDILLSQTIPIPPLMTAGELHDEMMEKGADLLGQALNNLKQGALKPTPQSEQDITYAHKISKQETAIDWTKPVHEVNNHIRGLSPFPGAWFLATTGSDKEERIKVLKSRVTPPVSPDLKINDGHIFVNCKGGAIQLLQLQKEGKKPLNAKDFINGLNGDLKIRP